MVEDLERDKERESVRAMGSSHFYGEEGDECLL